MCLVPRLLVPFSQHVSANKVLRISASPLAATVYSVRNVSEYSHHSLKLHKLKHKIDLACEW